MSNWNSFLKVLGPEHNYLHRLGFVLKRPKKRLLAKDEEPFVLQYSQIREEAGVEPRSSSWMNPPSGRCRPARQMGTPLVDSTRVGREGWGVCLETGEVEAMEIAGNSNAETSTAFLQQLRAPDLW